MRDLPFVRRSLRLLERALAAAGAVLLAYHAAFDLAEVVTPSMAPAVLGDGPGNGNDWVLTERLSLGVTLPPRFGIVTSIDEQGVTVLKRVAAFAGERVAIDDGALLVDGALAANAPPVRYLRAGHLRPRAAAQDYAVGPEQVFLLGDNQRDSWDSRFLGGVRRDALRGRAVAIVWPPARWRWLW